MKEQLASSAGATLRGSVTRGIGSLQLTRAAAWGKGIVINLASAACACVEMLEVLQKIKIGAQQTQLSMDLKLELHVIDLEALQSTCKPSDRLQDRIRGI